MVERHYPLGSPFRTLLDAMDTAGAERVSAADVVSSLIEDQADLPVRWTDDWLDAVDGSVAEGEHSSLDLNMPDDLFGADQLVGLVEAAAPAQVRVRCSAATARALEHTVAELRLLRAGELPWAIVDERVVVIGSSAAGQPAAVASGARIVTAFRRAVAP
jgi:hypothetical protein